MGSVLGINDNGDIVGWVPHATSDLLHHAYVSRASGTQDLGLTGRQSSVGIKIAPSGIIAGRIQRQLTSTRGVKRLGIRISSRRGSSDRAVRWRIN